MTTAQAFAGKFEGYLQEHMAQSGISCIRNPTLPDGKTPDFRVEHEGRACYVEATHVHGPDEFREKRGEEDLKELLEKGAPGGWDLLFQYPHGEVERLTDPISKKDDALRRIVEWLSTVDPSADGQPLRLDVRGVRVTLQAYGVPTAKKVTVGWIKSHGTGGRVTEKYEGFRDRLRGKYKKYTAEQESLGDVPLIVAIFDETLDRESVSEALYGTGVPYISLSRQTGKALGAGTNTLQDGVWLNHRDGELKPRHNHLAGVWHFQTMKDPDRPAAFFPNPHRRDLDSIILKPILQDAVWKAG